MSGLALFVTVGRTASETKCKNPGCRSVYWGELLVGRWRDDSKALVMSVEDWGIV